MDVGTFKLKIKNFDVLYIRLDNSNFIKNNTEYLCKEHIDNIIKQSLKEMIDKIDIQYDLEHMQNVTILN